MRQFSKALRKLKKKIMFSFGSALYWTDIKKFVCNNQKCFAFQIHMLITKKQQSNEFCVRLCSFLRNKNCYYRTFFITHSRFGHYFYSNLYGRAPRGPRGVKMTGRTQGSIPWYVFALVFSQNWENYKKPQKSTKIVKKRLFFGDFSNLIHFKLKTSAKTYHGINSWVLLVILTPLGSLGADPYRRY